jgi:uncharacterized membrane protein
MGWIYESIFCTIKNKKWADRGFLYGPVCPIYGVGAVSLTAIAEAVSERSADGFGCAGLLVVYIIAPFTQRMTSSITPIVMEGLSLLFMAMIAADATLTVSALTDFERNVAAFDTALNQHMEQTISSMGNVHRMAVSRVRGFRNTRADKQRMEDMLERMKSRVPKKK